MIHLVEDASAGSPVGEEERETDGLEDTGEGTDGNGVERALLGKDLGDDLEVVSKASYRVVNRWETYRRSRRSEEDQ
jgi:hypothetical protein